MKNNNINIRLTEKDKKTIEKNLKICTESHGQNCNLGYTGFDEQNER